MVGSIPASFSITVRASADRRQRAFFDFAAEGRLPACPPATRALLAAPVQALGMPADILRQRERPRQPPPGYARPGVCHAAFARASE